MTDCSYIRHGMETATIRTIAVSGTTGATASMVRIASTRGGKGNRYIYAKGDEEEIQMAIFDRFNVFRGSKDQDGGLRDEGNIYRGRVDGSDFYNAQDVYSGHMDDDGHMYDSNDCFVGTVDDNGDIYDDSGVYVGHVDD